MSDPTSSTRRISYKWWLLAGLLPVAALMAWVWMGSPDDRFEQAPGQQLILTGHAVHPRLTENDSKYFSEIARIAVTPSVMIAHEQLISEELTGGRSLSAGERHVLYAELAKHAATQIAAVSRSGVDRRIIKFASECRFNRLEASDLWARLQVPDLESAAARLAVGFIVDLMPDAQGRSKTAEQALGQAWTKSLSGTAEFLREAKSAADALQIVEQSLASTHLRFLREVGPEESLELPAYHDVVASAVTALEAKSGRLIPQLGTAALSGALVGRHSRRMNWDFLPDEIKELKILSQKAVGHCIVSEVEVSVVGKLAGPRKARIRLAHAALVSESPQLLFVE